MMMVLSKKQLLRSLSSISRLSSTIILGILHLLLFVSLISFNTTKLKIFLKGELLNFLLLGIQFNLTDKFLNDKFKWYGLEVMNYYSFSHKERMSPELLIRSVMFAYNKK